MKFEGKQTCEYLQYLVFKFRLPFTFVTFECSLAIIGPQNKFIYSSCREYDDNDDDNNNDDDDDNPLMDSDPPTQTDMLRLYLKKLFGFKCFSSWSISTPQSFHM
jgi:hypothetical protein